MKPGTPLVLTAKALDMGYKRRKGTLVCEYPQLGLIVVRLRNAKGVIENATFHISLWQAR